MTFSCNACQSNDCHLCSDQRCLLFSALSPRKRPSASSSQFNPCVHFNGQLSVFAATERARKRGRDVTLHADVESACETNLSHQKVFLPSQLRVGNRDARPFCLNFHRNCHLHYPSFPCHLLCIINSLSHLLSLPR